MRFGTPLRKLLRCLAALLIAAIAVIPALSAGAGYLVWDKAAPTTGRRGFDSISSSELYQAETTISLEELKAREDDTEEYIPHVWPVRFSDHGYISSYFGYRIDPVTGEGSEFHGGIDLADKLGTKIHASAVSQGQVIATMGATGRVTGVHCDFRVYLDGTAIDPLTVLDEE